MEGFVPIEDMGLLYADLSASFLALANALEAKGVLTKREFAEAAQERLLVLQAPGSPVDTSRLVLLHGLATQVDGRPAD